MSWKCGFGQVFKFGGKWSTTIDPHNIFLGGLPNQKGPSMWANMK